MLLLAALAPASAADTLSEAKARHLLTRTGFDPDATTLLRFQTLGHVRAVDALLDGLRTRAQTPPPAWVAAPLPDRRKLRTASASERKSFRKQRRRRGQALKRWWLTEMAVTDSPMTERMTLFWHNHFTSSLAKVREPVLLYRQNILLRRLGTDNFATLLKAVLRDPAMLIYLDNHRNNKRKPNENLARELLELFTLGEGHYSERDVREAARALTGHGVDRRTGKYQFRRKQHDAGLKQFLGRSGTFDVDDIVAELLRHPRTAQHLSEKLWRAFVGDPAPPAAVADLARQLRQHDYAIKPWLRRLLTMPDFISSSRFGTQIKSPVEFVISLVRVFDVPVNQSQQLARATRRLGQDLFNPPDVKGWPGGNSWLTTDTLIVRQHVLGRFLRGVPMAGGMQNKANMGRAGRREIMAGFAARLPAGMETFSGLAQLLLPIAPVGATDDVQHTTVQRTESLLMDPAYQLK